MQLLSAKIQSNVDTHLYYQGRRRTNGITANGGDPTDATDGAATAAAPTKHSDQKPKFFLPSANGQSAVTTTATTGNSSPRPVSENPPVIYGPDVFRLDTRE